MTRVLHMPRHAPDRTADVRSLFPCFDEPAWAGLHYLDNAATTQKAQPVIDAVVRAMRELSAPVHRGLYPLAEHASLEYERARKSLARFIGATHPDEVVFVSSATAAINQVAEGWLGPRLERGDEICVTRMEHHANLLPWQRLARRHGALLRVIELDGHGRLDLDSARAALGPRTRLLACVHVSNVLGTINPVQELARMAHAVGARILIDATQSVAHRRLDVQAIDCDFLVLSAHKMYGPAGAGLLWARAALLEEMEPLLLGGGMVDEVDPDRPRWRDPPQRFEAGSPDLPAILGMAAAAEVVTRLRSTAGLRGEPLSRHLLEGLLSVPGLRLLGPRRAEERLGLFSFLLDGCHPHDLAAWCGDRGVCVRAGHHCCQPLHDWLCEPGSVRASLAVYNTREDVDALIAALHGAREELR